MNLIISFNFFSSKNYKLFNMQIYFYNIELNIL